MNQTALSFAIPKSILIPSWPNRKSGWYYCSGKPQRFNLKASQSSTSASSFPLASRIIVRNLGYSVGESSLRKEFSSFGEIDEVKLVKDEAAKNSKPYAFIQYTCQDDAILALENMDRKIYDGRLIYVDLAKPGKRSFGEYPIASGPPKKQHFQQQDDVADCWY